MRKYLYILPVLSQGRRLAMKRMLKGFSSLVYRQYGANFAVVITI
jgi:hypothetical protein